MCLEEKNVCILVLSLLLDSHPFEEQAVILKNPQQGPLEGYKY